MTAKFFIDSNVWLYAFANDDPVRMSIAQSFIDEHVCNGSLFVSWQILNEVGCNLLKNGIADRIAFGMVERIRLACVTVNFSPDLLFEAFELRQRHSVSFWDSLVIAAAILADCDTLVSEDMQDGKRFGRLVVRNIF